MGHNNGIGHLLDDNQTVSIDPKQERTDRIATNLKKIESAVENHKDNLDALIEIDESLNNVINGNASTTHDETTSKKSFGRIAYAVLAGSTVFGLIIGMIVAGITGSLIQNVDFLKDVIVWIQLVIVLALGGLGCFIAYQIIDKRKRRH